LIFYASINDAKTEDLQLGTIDYASGTVTAELRWEIDCGIHKNDSRVLTLVSKPAHCMLCNICVIEYCTWS